MTTARLSSLHVVDNLVANIVGDPTYSTEIPLPTGARHLRAYVKQSIKSIGAR